MKKRIEMLADIFLIPNGVSTINNNFVTMEGELEFISEVATMNPLPDDGCKWNTDLSTEPLVQVCLVSTSPEIPSENLVVHGFKDLSGTYRSIESDWLPVKLFQTFKEGDIITIKLPLTGDDAILAVHATLAQTKYKYASYGDFHDVLRSQVNHWKFTGRPYNRVSAR